MEYSDNRAFRTEDQSERRLSLNEDYREDSLLVQIDAFRDKARQLQKLISAKQSKVASLESMVRDKEDELADKQLQIELLQEELADKQRQADGLVASVEIQVDRMLRSMKSDFNELGRRLETKMDNIPGGVYTSIDPTGDRVTVKAADVNYDSIGRIVEDKVSRGCDAIIKVVEDASFRNGVGGVRDNTESAYVPSNTSSQAADLSPELFDKMDKLSNEITSLREEIQKKSEELENTSDLLESANDEIADQKNEIEDQQTEIIEQQNEIEELKNTLTELINSNFKELKGLLPSEDEEVDENADTLTTVKEELSEKIHSENVKVFRNIQDTLKELDLKEEVDLSLEVRYRSLRNRIFWTTSLLIVNVGLSIVLLLSVLNII
ncbi:MAG: hypothetical protein K6F00_02485 [Lachnospiraceae bacterium]|nr:hypothetical protein [Lachnospiraceae bacterium]